MIYEKADIWSNFNSSSQAGKSNDILVALGSLIREDKDAVIEAFRQSGIPFPTDASNEQVSNAVVNVLRKNTKQSNDLLKYLSTLILASKEQYTNFINRKNKTKSDKPKGGFLKGLKGLFQRTENADGTKTSKIGNFFRQNKDEVLGIAGNLMSGIGNRNASTQILNQSTLELQQQLEREAKEREAREAEERRRAYSRRIMIGVALVAIVGGGIYFYMKSQKK